MASASLPVRRTIIIVAGTGNNIVVAIGWRFVLDRTAVQRLAKTAVVTVDVAKLDELAVGVGANGKVGQVHRNRRRQRDVPTAVPHAADLIRRHSLVVLEDHFSKLARLLDAHAAVAQGAVRLSEQSLLRRVGHVDVVPIGKAELDVAEWVLATRRLSKAELPDIDAVPIDFVGVDWAAVERRRQFVSFQYAGAAA